MTADFHWTRITGDDDTVDARLAEGAVKPEAPSADDLLWASEWLATYGCHDDLEIAQQIANVIGFLERKAEEKQRRSRLSETKRRFAAERGIPVSQVRVTR